VPSVVAGFLQLLARQPEVPLATIADVLMFAAGEKPAMRFAVPGRVRAELDRWASASGLASGSRTLGLKRVSDWNCIGVDGSSATDHIDVVVYAKSEEFAAMICEVEANGGSERSGLLLGYPPCCVAAYGGYSDDPANWIGQALARSGVGPFPCWANRLPISWGAPTFIGELYPCSFDCEGATRQGRAVFGRLREYGLDQLAQTILAEAIRPVAGGRMEAPIEVRRVSTAPDYNFEFVA
jgi:hypothetical protein